MGWKPAPRDGARYGPAERPLMSSFFNDLREFIWLRRHGFRAAEYIRGNERISMHACGWRANGSGRMKSARDAVAYLEGSMPEQWRQIYCGMTPFLVSDRGNVRLIDGSEPKMFLANGRYQIAYKPEEVHPSRRGRRGGMAHKKRVYRSVLVAMAFLDFKKGDEEHEVHHVNGYRTDDRLVNLMVLTHDEHTRIHNMGPCGLTAPVDEAVHDAGLLAEAKPMGKLKLRRMKKRALDVALVQPKELPAAEEATGATEYEPGSRGNEQSSDRGSTRAPKDDAAKQRSANSSPERPDHTAILNVDAPSGTFAFAPLPVLDETGTFTTPEAPEVAAAKQAQADAREAERAAAKQRAEAEAAALAAIPARGEHKAEEKSTLQAAAEEGMARVDEKLEGAPVRSGARAQESLNNEGPSKAAKHRASRKRSEQRRAKAEARNDAPKVAAKEKPPVNDTPEAESEPEESMASKHPADAEPTGEGPRTKLAETPKEAPRAEAAEAIDATVAAENDATPKPNTAKKQPKPKKPDDEQNSAAQEKQPEPQANEAPTDWIAARNQLVQETKAYLKAARKLVKRGDATDKQFAAAAKPVYKTFKPFLTCNDAVVVFDACLACIRLIAKDAESSKKHGAESLPQSTHSMVGTLQKSLKSSVRKLMREDEIVATCTEELLREEAARPSYRALGANPLQHCINIVDSKKQAKTPVAGKTQPKAPEQESPAPKGNAAPDPENPQNPPASPADADQHRDPAVNATKPENGKPAGSTPDAPTENLREGNASSTKRRNARRRNRTKRAKEIMEAKD